MGVGTVLLAAFIATPIVEIWLLIAVGGVIGALPTIALVVLKLIQFWGVLGGRRDREAADRSGLSEKVPGDVERRAAFGTAANK